MFIGHYAYGFYLKSKNTCVPLWLIFLGVQLVDLLWAVFVMVGIERASFNPEASVFLRAVYEYYPYTHSLFTSIAIAALVSFIVYHLHNKRWAVVAFLAVVSHWFLDVLVHIPDVPIWFNSYKIGLGLWNFPAFTLILEILLFTAALIYYLRTMSGGRNRKWVISLYLFLVIFYIASYFAPAVPPTTVQLGIFGILIYGGVPLVAYFVEKQKEQSQII